MVNIAGRLHSCHLTASCDSEQASLHKPAEIVAVLAESANLSLAG